MQHIVQSVLNNLWVLDKSEIKETSEDWGLDQQISRSLNP